MLKRVEIFDPYTGKTLMFVPFRWIASLIVKLELYKHCDYGTKDEIEWLN